MGENLTKNARKPLCFLAEMPSAKYCTILTFGLNRNLGLKDFVRFKKEKAVLFL